MSHFDDELTLALQQRHLGQRYRQRHILDSPQAAHIDVGDRSWLAFCSNDYLGLANHPDVVAAMQQATATHGVGSGASHLLYGHSRWHHDLENAIARFTGRERALLFSTGYMANLGVISALSRRGDTVYEDRLNHASLIDAGLLSRAQVKRYRHNDIKQLEGFLRQDRSPRKLVVVDGVFSMDGDIAPLPQLADLCRRYHAQLMVDDAHGFGVLGNRGGGCAEHFQLDAEQLPILVGTLGKAFGTFGAFVAGSSVLIETLIQFSRPYIYTTAMPPALAAASRVSLRLLSEEHHRRDHLQVLIRHFREGANSIGLPLMDSSTPIQPIVLGEDHQVMWAAEQLRHHGILTGAVRPPAVPEGTARLRITFNANHQIAQVDCLLEALQKIMLADSR